MVIRGKLRTKGNQKMAGAKKAWTTVISVGKPFIKLICM